MLRTLFYLTAAFTLILITALPAPAASVLASPESLSLASPVIVNHRHTDLSQIPLYWINKAKQLAVHYAHTSHGGQILSGLETLESANAAYNIDIIFDLNDSWDNTALRFYDGNNYGGDNYITPEMYWETEDGVDHTRSTLDSGKFDFSLWTWCGQMSYYSSAQINKYKNTLNQLESEYPAIGLIYYTGHLDGSAPGSVLWRNNNAVRSYVYANNKILFDFADIESYDPSGTFHPNGSDACEWCEDWCSNHPADCQNLPASCDHSHPLQCKLKANAFWWLMARMAGWDGPDAAPTQTLTTRSQGDQDGWVLESSETSNQGGMINAGGTTFNLGDNPADRQYRNILSFNTASLPDNAVITRITLKIKRQSLVGVNPFDTHGLLVVDARHRIFTNSAALQANDFQAASSLQASGFFNKTPAATWYSAVLKSAVIPYINISGLTQFRLRFNKDDNDDLNADYIRFSSGNAPLASRPQLIIEYYMP